MKTAKELIKGYVKKTKPSFGVRCIETGEEWNTLIDAAKELEINSKYLYVSIHQRGGKFKGLTFEFVRKE